MARSLAYDPRYAQNAICPYFTMFPLEYPVRVLRRHRPQRPVVLDPFCGRGTTLYAARLAGLTALGIDTSPIAVAIAKAKLCTVDPPAVLDLLDRFLAEPANAAPDTPFFQHAYHPRTLRELCALREGLLRAAETPAAVLLRALALGSLHGPRTRDPARQAYFSNQMPRTFSSKPDYSVRFWLARGLAPPDVRLRDILAARLKRLALSHDRPAQDPAQVWQGDAVHAVGGGLPRDDFAVIVTSPPYYGLRTYREDQWLRDWFLGGPATLEYGDHAQVSHAGPAAFAESLGAVWANLARSRAPTLELYVRFGLLPSLRQDAKALLQTSFEASRHPWQWISVRPARTADHGRRQAAQMGAASVAALELDVHLRRLG